MRNSLSCYPISCPIFEDGIRERKAGGLSTQPRRSGEGCFGGDKATEADPYILKIAAERVEFCILLTCSFSRSCVQVEERFTTFIETTVMCQGCGK
jgi:hypothetical protein